MSLERKTVVVVGGSSGIGLASAAAAAAEGARVVIAGRSEERLSAARLRHGSFCELGCGLAAPIRYAPNMGALVPASAWSTSSEVRSTLRPSGGS